MSDAAGPSRSSPPHLSITTADAHATPDSHTGKGKGKTPLRAKPTPRPVEAFENPDEGEEETVHEVYERIAPHFSQTRHKPWPLITNFLNDLPPGSVGLDSGAGNGKYLPTAHQAGHTMIALDRSEGLLGIARGQEGAGDVVRGDLGARCWRQGVYDFVISVAAIHHLSTPERRRQAVQAILPCLRSSTKPPYARFFIYVWAYEQGPLSKRAMGSLSTESDPQAEKVQDVLVPWVLKPKPRSKSKSQDREQGQEAEDEEDKVYHRYYHLFVKDELRELVSSAAEAEGCRVLDLDPNASEGEAGTVTSMEGQKTGDAGGRWMRIRGEGWEADNWWIEAEVGEGLYARQPHQAKETSTTEEA